MKDNCYKCRQPAVETAADGKRYCAYCIQYAPKVKK